MFYRKKGNQVRLLELVNKIIYTQLNEFDLHTFISLFVVTLSTKSRWRGKLSEMSPAEISSTSAFQVRRIMDLLFIRRAGYISPSSKLAFR